ncbi:MAG: hypothetical protein U0Q16_18225 [Bryobacteraceae bacterium]
MTALVHQRCFHHVSREAVSRCPECRRFFCRECVVDHDGRLLCSGCLAKLQAPAEPRKKRTGLRWTAAALVGLLAGWMCFYYVGSVLARLPSEFHESEEAAP